MLTLEVNQSVDIIIQKAVDKTDLALTISLLDRPKLAPLLFYSV